MIEIQETRPEPLISVSGEASDNTFQYTGRENDGTGLYYYRARYYSPDLQRFISEDPIGLEGGDVNFYAYVGNNPVNETDPLGLSNWVCSKKSDGRIRCEWIKDPPMPPVIEEGMCIAYQIICPIVGKRLPSLGLLCNIIATYFLCPDKTGDHCS